ncbi:hypothetical protein [Fodinicurvata sp. EGI_FJ10296]|uniref:hypothetical protein n=1 Tax=Fodinicurvata sp. EGI_FJ10296 TaxID=3231908 RepID=UPI003454C4A2
MQCSRYVRKPQDEYATVPFSSAEEVWFWFIRAHEASAAGARARAGMALYPRPCEPVDVARVVDRLYRQRRLLRDHLLVLAHYGRRLMAPNPDYRQEIKASSLWREAFDRIEPALRSKGIVA